MPWVALIGAAVSYAGSRSSSRRARSAQQSQQDIAQQQADLAKEQLALARQQYDDWRNTFFPIGQELAAMSRQEVKPDFDRIAADNRMTFDAQRGAMTRAAQRFGMNPADGAWATGVSRLNSEEAKTHVLARNRAREDAKGQQFRNMATAYGIGSGMPGMAAQTMSSATGLMSNAAGGFGNAAQFHGQQAQDTAYALGNLTSSIPWGDIWSSVRPASAGGSTTQPYTVPNYGMQPGPYAGGYQYPVTSSEKTKDNVTPVNPKDALDTVMSTPVVSYNYHGNPTSAVGTIAEAAPSAISNGQQVSLENQVGVLNGAVQELAQQVTGAKPKSYGMDKTTGSPVATSSAPMAKNGGFMSAFTGTTRPSGRRNPPRALLGAGLPGLAAYGIWAGVNALRDRRDARAARGPAGAPYSGPPALGAGAGGGGDMGPGQPYTVPGYGGGEGSGASPGTVVAPRAVSTRHVPMRNLQMLSALVSAARTAKSISDMKLHQFQGAA